MVGIRNGKAVDEGAGAGHPASDALRSAAFGLLEAADKEEIADDTVLGIWVRSQHEALLRQADLFEHFEERVFKAIENVRDLTVSEVHRLRNAAAVVMQETEKLRAMQKVTEAQASQSIAQFMRSAKPEMIAALKSVAVVYERRWNQRRNIAGVVAAAAVLLAAFGGGFVAAGWRGQAVDASYVAAKAAVDRCRQAAAPDKATGQLWCPVKVLDESGS
jgi:hypothetical protein